MFAHLYTFTLLCLLARAQANTNTQLGVNHMSGDQTVGGIHFFEIHTPSGGMGLGIKLFLGALIAIAVAYWCIRRKAKQTLRRYAAGIQTVSGALPQQPALPAGYQLVPISQPTSSRRPHRSTRVGPFSDDDPDNITAC